MASPLPASKGPLAVEPRGCPAALLFISPSRTNHFASLAVQPSSLGLELAPEPVHEGRRGRGLILEARRSGRAPSQSFERHLLASSQASRRKPARLLIDEAIDVRPLAGD